MHVLSFHDFGQKFLLLTQEGVIFKCRNSQFGEGQMKRRWCNLLSGLSQVLIAFMERGWCICSRRASFVFPIVFVKVVSHIGLSCRVGWEERESGPRFTLILDGKVSSYRGHMSLISPAHRSLHLVTEWMCVMEKQYFAQSSLTSEQNTKSDLFAEQELSCFILLLEAYTNWKLWE